MQVVPAYTLLEGPMSDRRNSGLSLEVVTDLARFRNLRDPWTSLLRDSHQQSLVLTHEWLSAWWDCFGSGKHLWVACLRRGERLVGILPFWRDRVRYRGMEVDMLRLFANGHSPYSDLILAADLDSAGLHAAVQLLLATSATDVVVFAKLPETSRLFRYFSSSPGGQAKRCGIRPSLVTPIVTIEQDWGTFFSKRSRNLRKGINHRLNRLRRRGEIDIERLTVATREDPVLAEIVQVSHNSWKAQVGTDLGGNKAGLAFILALVDAFGASGCIQVWLLRIDGTPVAYEFHVVYGGVVYPLRADFDERFRDLSPGSVLLYSAMKRLFEEGGVTQYYSCADDYQYLRSWTDERRHHFDVEVFGDGAVPRFLHGIEYGLIPIARSLRDHIKGMASRTPRREIHKLSAAVLMGTPADQVLATLVYSSLA